MNQNDLDFYKELYLKIIENSYDEFSAVELSLNFSREEVHRFVNLHNEIVVKATKLLPEYEGLIYELYGITGSLEKMRYDHISDDGNIIYTNEYESLSTAIKIPESYLFGDSWKELMRLQFKAKKDIAELNKYWEELTKKGKRYILYNELKKEFEDVEEL